MGRSVTYENNPLTLEGRPLSLSAKAPNFTACDIYNEEIDLQAFGGTTKLITSFLSIDTPVCDLQIREFNRLAKESSRSGVTFFGISRDLPFALKRFCDTFNIRDITLISDYRHSCFGINYGLLIREWNLLARSVLILDGQNALRYIQIVEELTNPPDFEDSFKHLETILNSQPGSAEIHTPKPADAASRKERLEVLSEDAARNLLARHPEWEMVDGKKITKHYTFKNFLQAKHFLDIISCIAEEQGHHPSFSLNYNRLKVTLTSHEAGGLTQKDFTMANVIDELY